MKPKDKLLTAASDNPNQMLLVWTANNEIACSIEFVNPGDALYMLYILQAKLDDLIKSKFNAPENTTT